MTSKAVPPKRNVPVHTGMDRRSFVAAAGGLASASLFHWPGLAAPVGSQVAHPTDQRTATETIAEFLVRTKFEDIPAPVVLKAKEQLVFFLGRAFEGRSTPVAEQVRSAFRDASNPTGVTVIGERIRLPLADAAFANCTLMRGELNNDDVIWPSGIHAGVIVYPTALAVGEARRASGRELLRAIVLGYEVVGKLARVSWGWAAPLPRRPTIIFGPFASICAAGLLLGLPRQQLVHALGYGANIGIGVPEGGMTQHYYSFINRNGIIAAQVAEAGGAPYARTTIEGDLGLYRSFFGKVPEQLPAILGTLGSDWEILTAEQKRYPGTGANTVATEIFGAIVREHDLKPSDVVSIQAILSEEREARSEVTRKGPFSTLTQAYSSLPYALALMLIERRIDARWYAKEAGPNVYNHPAVLEQAQKVRVSYEPHALSRWARLEIETKSGRRIVRASENFSFPFPPAAWRSWLQASGNRILPSSRLERLEREILQLEEISNVSRLMALLVPPKRSGEGPR